MIEAFWDFCLVISALAVLAAIVPPRSKRFYRVPR